MMKLSLLGLNCAWLCLATVAPAQSLPDQKLEAEIAKLQVETAKAKVDTEKARIEADNALFSVIRGATGGSASVTGGEKTAEGLLLSRASLAGASAMVVARLADVGITPAPDIRPVVVWGSTPPSVAQWLIFKDERDRIGRQLRTANAAWSDANGNKMGFLPAAAAVATLVATVIPLIKTDTTLAGGSVSFEESDARAGLTAALQQAGYGAFASLDVLDGAALAADLLSPIADHRETARAAYEDQYLAFFEGRLKEGGRSDRIKSAAAKLKAALDAHKGLRDQLMADTGGIVTAGMIDRQRQLHENPSKHPLVYLINVDAAYTSTTKKGLFTGIGGTVPAFGSVSTIVDYAVVGPKGEHRGTASCTMGNRPVKDMLVLQPAAYSAQGAAICDGSPR